MKNPWIKLYRNVLNDEKVSFILRRYGHDCLTFWIGILTKCDDGVLSMDEDMFADLCLLETKRYEEIRDVFIKRGLVELTDEGQLAVVNWDEYQVGESTKRVRNYRERQCNGDETPCNAHETEKERLEGEEEGDKEGEGERAHEAAPPLVKVIEEASPRAVVADWYSALSREINGTAPPEAPKAEAWAAGVVAVCGGDLAKAKRFRAEYFASWKDLWFAKTKAGAPDFDFRAYCGNISTLAARVETLAPKGYGPCIPSTSPPPTPEEREAAACALGVALAGGFLQAVPA